MLKTSGFLILIALLPVMVAAEAPSDAQLRSALESALEDDPNVDAGRLAVDVDAGIVQLSGEAAHLLERERAARIALALRGVRSVSNRIEVMPTAHSDAGVRADIITVLTRDPVTESFEIMVSVDHGSVQLRGQVQSWQERRMCERLAKTVRGVRAVDNQIRIDYPRERSDAEIHDDVFSRLYWDVLVDVNALEIGVSQGVVTLSGSVRTAAEAQRARALAWVVGVRKLVDAIEVVFPQAESSMRADRYPAVDDPAIEAAIADAYLYDPRVVASQVEVESLAGTVTLRGIVSTLAGKRAAEQIATNTVGVVEVRNRLRVRSPHPPGAQEIAEALRARLASNPVTAAQRIEVAVHGGVVVLRGEVATDFERLQAEQMAIQQRGVEAVRNRLEVRQRRDSALYSPDTPLADPWLPEWEELAPSRAGYSDERLVRRIRDCLAANPYVLESRVQVTVEADSVRLTGAVGSWTARRAATVCAYEAGAGFVDNQLTVE